MGALFVDGVGVAGEDCIDACSLGHGGCQVVDGVLAVDMEGDLHRAALRGDLVLAGGGPPVAECLGGHIIQVTGLLITAQPGEIER